LNELTVVEDRRQTTFHGEFGDQSSIGNVFGFLVHYESLGTLLRKGGKYPLVLLLIHWMLEGWANQGNLPPGPIRLPFRVQTLPMLPRISRLQCPQSGYLRCRFLQ